MDSPRALCYTLRHAIWLATRRGDRVVEGNGLENRHTGNGIEGSNPSLSATSKNEKKPRSAGLFYWWT